MEHLHKSKGFDETVLKRQYGYFEYRLAKTFVETRVRLMTLESRDASLEPDHGQGNWDTLKALDDASTEQYLNDCLDPTLRSEPLDPCLKIW